MDVDDSLPRKARDLVAEVAKQDLDPLSIDELHERIAMLENEIARVRQRIVRASDHRASADALFRR